ncbi:LEAF RUST 10 DISEASE-RESISTANCE LOCUS RECEPTOR-LIKE PROTEIN KINASE-like 2.4 [Cucumis melo var. makuwa]|nr:LEAF RUST 10 DISEASE-RESISTANCE LOCUS RECEPTOR-LIKE PROTEIN KINASE-like 2.4 [Cucumis melo var. makuwa]
MVWFDVQLCLGDDNYEQFKYCRVNYNCGDLVDISYPFWGNERPEFCGRREFGLNCKDNKTMIRINNRQYIVVDISQSNNRMTIARSELFDDYCPNSQIKVATLLDFSLFSYTSNNQNLSLWYNCPPLVNVPSNFTFECGGEEEESNRRVNYALDKNEAKNWSSYMGDCSMNIEVTITGDVLRGGVKNRTRVVERGLKEGFEVEYGDSYTIACDGCTEYGGQCGSVVREQFACFCGGGIYPYVCGPPSPPAAASGAIILIISIIICIYCTIKCISNKDKIIEESIRRYSTLTPKRYSYSKLKKITNSFKNKLGQGGFSTVYKGKLPDGRDVAVKVLNKSSENGQDFINEVVNITRTSHVNIVSLIGFCYERKKRALIYEYMSRGSLDKYISHKGPQTNNDKLDWNTLYRIVIGVARGLEYLHRGCNTRILHFDIKPHNILLDSDFCPKISDFGLAKQCKAGESHVTMTGVKGTVGFIAPELIFRNIGNVSHKSDVYSYGMLVLEMVGARKNPNDGVGQNGEEFFPDWIYNTLTQSEIDEDCLWGNTEEEKKMTRKMIIVGLHCIQTLPNDRPSLTDVVAMLEGSVNGLQIPPKPNLFGPPTFEHPQPSSSSFSSIEASQQQSYLPS